jgi:hypothetical protein
MINYREKFSGLAKFMAAYWMENGDLVYSNLTGATMAFINSESDDTISRLLSDIGQVETLGFLDTACRVNQENDFWSQFGARYLTGSDAILIRSLIKRALLG